MKTTCKLCLLKKDIKKSHAIANSVFKKITRQNDGKGITLTPDDKEITYSSDSWAEHQLCGSCEGLLSDTYEKYSLEAIRGKKVTVTKMIEGISIQNIDLHKFNMFFLSILWRASISNHAAYREVELGNEINEYLRSFILNDKKIPIVNFSVKISRLIDRSEGFDMKTLKNFVTSLFYRKLRTGSSYCFVIEGFFIEIIFPGLKLSQRNKPGVIRSTKRIIFIPLVHIFDIPELKELMVINYAKHVEGRSKINKSKS